MRRQTITFCLRVSALAFALGMFFLFCTHACGQTARWVKLPEVRRQTGPGLVAEMVAYPHTAELAGCVQRVEQLHRKIASRMGGR